MRAPGRAISVEAVAVPLFAATLFLSGFLIFLVEPMIARMVLPVLGGVPMVWNACVVFFQIVMLAGYGYAFAASRALSVRRHVALHAALLVAPALVLPVVIDAGSVAPPAGNPVGWLLLLLAGTVGLPFFVLSTTASALQDWLSRTDHPSGRDPYFLYAASNAGCMLALAVYPALVEPTLTLREQSRMWAAIYVVFALLAAVCGAFAWRYRTDAVRLVTRASTPLTLARRARWILLAFIPSSLMLAVTSHISTDIASVPLLWLVPLALYLLTFTLAFGRYASKAAAIAALALPLLVVPLALFMVTGIREPLVTIVVIHVAAFAAIAMNCHADLAKDRPGPAHLTEFYFWLSFGGMLGGLFNTLAAPLIFRSVVEYPIVIMLACLCFRSGNASATAERRVATAAVPLAVAALTAAALLIARARGAGLMFVVVALIAPVLLTFAQRRRGSRFGLSLAAFLAVGVMLSEGRTRVLYATRTFFGVYRVTQDGAYHGLAHGTTMHGMQALASERRGEALTYYHATGPFGQAWTALSALSPRREIAVVGLGVGTLATYAGPDQRWTFFEIDPAIERIARTSAYFSFMDACADRCRVVIGDARVSLARVPERTYDLLALDAFSSDSIPIHLMTREAVDLYASRLAPRGVILMHVSNRHLRLAPVVGRLAAERGLTALHQIESSRSGWAEGKSGSHWIVLAHREADLGALATDPRWKRLDPSPSAPLWTDDFSNILSVLSLR